MTARKLSAAQMSWNQYGTSGMNKQALRAIRQLAQSRRFTYDGALRPTCLRCGMPREDRKAQRCNDCQNTR